MSDDRIRILGTVFADVLEQMAFMFAEPPENNEIDINETEVVKVSMGFNRADAAECPASADADDLVQGSIDMVVPRSMCEELAANVLGLEADDEMVQRAPFDALKELLNITCGNVLTAIAGDEPVFDLTIPAIAPIEEVSWASLAARPGTVYYQVDEYPVLLHLDCKSHP